MYRPMEYQVCTVQMQFLTAAVTQAVAAAAKGRRNNNHKPFYVEMIYMYLRK